MLKIKKCADDWFLSELLLVGTGSIWNRIKFYIGTRRKDETVRVGSNCLVGVKPFRRHVLVFSKSFISALIQSSSPLVLHFFIAEHFANVLNKHKGIFKYISLFKRRSVQKFQWNGKAITFVSRPLKPFQCFRSVVACLFDSPVFILALDFRCAGSLDFRCAGSRVCRIYSRRKFCRQLVFKNKKN